MSEPFLGEIRTVGFNFAPQGWALCDGQLLPINQNTALEPGMTSGVAAVVGCGTELMRSLLGDPASLVRFGAWVAAEYLTCRPPWRAAG